MNWQSVVERTVTGLGYDLVDAEKGVGGLLRVYIDHLVDHPVDQHFDHPGAPASKAAYRFITVDDCEKVTRQLQHVLEVEGCNYERLEVSSPGLDRPLKRPADYARFAGEQVEVTLKLPFNGRKKYRGELQAGAAVLGEGGWQLKLGDPQAPRKGKGPGRRSEVAAGSEVDQVLEFSLDEVREARLVPVVDFNGRRVARDGSGGAGSHPEDMVDGGRIQ